MSKRLASSLTALASVFYLGVHQPPAAAGEGTPAYSKFDLAVAHFSVPRKGNASTSYLINVTRKWDGVSTTVRVALWKIKQVCRAGDEGTTCVQRGQPKFIYIDPEDFEFDLSSGARVVVRSEGITHRMRWKVTNNSPVPEGYYTGGWYCSDESYESGGGPSNSARAKGTLFGKRFSKAKASFLATGVMESEGSCPDRSRSLKGWTGSRPDDLRPSAVPKKVGRKYVKRAARGAGSACPKTAACRSYRSAGLTLRTTSSR